MEKPLKPGDILEGNYWPEPVRVLTANQVGTLTRLEVVGTESGHFYGETWLSRSDMLPENWTTLSERTWYHGSAKEVAK